MIFSILSYHNKPYVNVNLFILVLCSRVTYFHDSLTLTDGEYTCNTANTLLWYTDTGQPWCKCACGSDSLCWGRGGPGGTSWLGSTGGSGVRHSNCSRLIRCTFLKFSTSCCYHKTEMQTGERGGIVWMGGMLHTQLISNMCFTCSFVVNLRYF